MVRTCCVPGCNSNYYDSYVPTFVFPKSQALREKWIKNIRRSNFEYTNKTAVCAKHFEPQCIIREDIFPIIDGEPIRIPRKNPRLSADAIPTIFPDESIVSLRKHRIPKTSEESQFQEATQGQKENCVKLCKQNGSLDVSGMEHDTPEVPMSKSKRSANLKLDRSCKISKLGHFEENQFESHRLDGQQKLKPFAVPTNFNTAGLNDDQTNVESSEQHEPEITFHKQIKIESVISLCNVVRALNAASNVTQKKKSGRPRFSKKKSTVQQRRTSARLSVRGRRKWTNFYKEEYETNTQSKKIQNKLWRTCPKEVRVVIERIPQRTVPSTLEKGPSKERIPRRTVQSRSEKGSCKEGIPRLSIHGTSEEVPSEDRISRLCIQGTSEICSPRITRCSLQGTSEKGPFEERIPRCSHQGLSQNISSKEIIPQRCVCCSSRKSLSKACISRCSIQSTIGKGLPKERKSRCSLRGMSRKGPSKERIPEPTVQSTSEEGPSKETLCIKRIPSNMPSRKRSGGSAGTTPRPRKIQRIDDKSEETQVSYCLENSQDDAAEGEKVPGDCVVCNKHVEQGTMLDTLSSVSKEHFHEKLSRLVMGQDTITFKKDGVLCSICTSLLNYMDRIEVEMSMLKTAVIRCMRKNHVLKQDSNSLDQSQHKSSVDNSKIDVPPPVNLDCTEEDGEQKDGNETLPDLGEHIGDVDNHVDINNVEPPGEAQCDGSEQPDPSSDAAISEESKTKANDKKYECRICMFKTCRKSVMIFHLRQHVKENFRCDFCNLNIPEDSEHIKYMLAHPPYLCHRKKVILLPVEFRCERPISNTNTDLVVKRDLSLNIPTINSETLSDNVVKVDTSDQKTSSLLETNAKLLGNGNNGTKMSCDIKVQDNISALKNSDEEDICKTNKNLVKCDLKCHPPEGK